MVSVNKWDGRKTIDSDDTVESERVPYDSMMLLLMEIIKKLEIRNDDLWIFILRERERDRDDLSHTTFHCCGHCMAIS